MIGEHFDGFDFLVLKIWNERAPIILSIRFSKISLIVRWLILRILIRRFYRYLYLQILQNRTTLVSHFSSGKWQIHVKNQVPNLNSPVRFSLCFGVPPKQPPQFAFEQKTNSPESAPAREQPSQNQQVLRPRHPNITLTPPSHWNTKLPEWFEEFVRYIEVAQLQEDPQESNRRKTTDLANEYLK